MLHILEVKWKRNQNADMIYKDFYPFYASYANPMLYRGRKNRKKSFPDEILLSGDCQKDSGESGRRM